MVLDLFITKHLGYKQRKTIPKACLKVILQFFCNSLSKILPILEINACLGLLLF